MYTRRVLTAFEISGQRSSIQKKHSRPFLISSAKVVWVYQGCTDTEAVQNYSCMLFFMRFAKFFAPIDSNSLIKSAASRCVA